MSQQAKSIERAQTVLPAGGFGNFDRGIAIKEGKGSRVWGEDGNDYIIANADVALTETTVHKAAAEQ